jgi:plastocyanin
MDALIPRRARWILAMATAAVALVLASQASAGPLASASGTTKVKIVNFKFKPGSLTVGVGTKVSFSNAEAAGIHTATSSSFDTGSIGPGRSVVVKFTRRGTFAYHCTPHPSMRGKIVVK